jgi:hypothetical protein
MIIFSCIITKNQTVYVHPNPLIYYHDDIMSFYKLKESNKDVSFNYFVKVKIYPTKSNVIDKPIDWRDWNFILDNAGEPTLDDFWCYEGAKGLVGIAVWDGVGDDPPGGWHRHGGSGRRRPDGDASREYVNP